MKLKFFALTLSLSLLAQITPASGNDLKTFPCGDGATYSVSMPDGVALEGNQCSGTLTIDSSVRIIGSFAFKGSRLTSVIIPDSVFEIGWQAFWSIHLETVRLGSSVLHIGNSAFKNTKISRIEFPSKLLSIGDEAFASTTYLGWGGTKIIVPDSVRAIGDKAFSSSRIELISIPDKLIFLGKDVFVATNLRSVDYCGNLEGFHASTNLYARPIEIVKPNCSPERKLQAAAFSSLEMEAILAAEFLNAISSFSDVSKEQLREARRAAELKIKQKENATAELEAKQEAEAKARAAAELKAKQEAEAKAAAELKAKQEAEEKAEAKAAADKVICDANRAQLLSVQASLQAAIKSYPKSASALNDTRLRLQTALSSNCIADVTLNDFRSEINSVIAEAKKSSVAKQTSITCVKGAIVKKVMAVNPKCPRGYKKK